MAAVRSSETWVNFYWQCSSFDRVSMWWISCTVQAKYWLPLYFLYRQELFIPVVCIPLPALVFCLSTFCIRVVANYLALEPTFCILRARTEEGHSCAVPVKSDRLLAHLVRFTTTLVGKLAVIRMFLWRQSGTIAGLSSLGHFFGCETSPDIIEIFSLDVMLTT
jgi:hypothetical protein